MHNTVIGCKQLSRFYQQVLNDSAGSEPKATKVPNWTSFLNDNGTTPVVSPLPVASNLSSTNNLGMTSLPATGTTAAGTQHTSSSPSHTAETLASGARSSQPGTKASLADPTQSQASAMLSQAGLPQSTGDTVPQSQTERNRSQAGLSQSLGSSDKSAQSQTGAGSSSQGMPDDWDWETYLKLNPDVAEAVGGDANSARQHWQEWGRLEQRSYKVVSTAFRLLRYLLGTATIVRVILCHMVVSWACPHCRSQPVGSWHWWKSLQGCVGCSPLHSLHFVSCSSSRKGKFVCSTVAMCSLCGLLCPTPTHCCAVHIVRKHGRMGLLRPLSPQTLPDTVVCFLLRVFILQLVPSWPIHLCLRFSAMHSLCHCVVCMCMPTHTCQFALLQYAHVCYHKYIKAT